MNVWEWWTIYIVAALIIYGVGCFLGRGGKEDGLGGLYALPGFLMLAVGIIALGWIIVNWLVTLLLFESFIYFLYLIIRTDGYGKTNDKKVAVCFCAVFAVVALLKVLL